MSNQEKRQQFTINNQGLFVHHVPYDACLESQQGYTALAQESRYEALDPSQPEGMFLTAQTHSAYLTFTTEYRNVPVRDRLLVARFIRRNAKMPADNQINSLYNSGKRSVKRATLIGEGHFGGGEVYALPGTNLAIKVVDIKHRTYDASGASAGPPSTKELVHMANLYEMVKRYGSGKVVIPKHYALITPRGGAFKNVYMVMELMSPDTWIPPSKIPPSQTKRANALVNEALDELYRILEQQPGKNVPGGHLWANDLAGDNILVNLKEGKVCFVDQYCF